MLWLLACAPSQERLCREAREAREAAWQETVDFYERVGEMEASELHGARAQLDAASSEREAATASRATYARRSVGGLTDMRTGEVRRDLDANAANRRRAAAAAARVEEAAEAEAGAAADWLEADLRARQLEDRLELAKRLRDGEADLDEAQVLTDTTLAADALAASRRAEAACSPEPAGP